MRYKKASFESTIKAARKAVEDTGKGKFVFATVYGFTIADYRPSFQQHVYVNPKKAGGLEYYEYNYQDQTWHQWNIQG